MATSHTANVKQWLEQSDIDYFTHFVKAWIPFNAWYRHAYDAIESERDVLEEVKTDGNKIRTRFIAKLEGTDPESEEIRNHIAALHRRLAADPLEDRKKRRISFENVCIGRNPNAKESLTTYGWKYTVERQKSPAKQVVCEIINKSGVRTNLIAHGGEWELELIIGNAEYLSLSPTDRSRVLACYKQANPYRFKTLLAASSDKTFLEMDGYRFVDDRPELFAGLVDVLYAMRNLLFHGELVPDQQANRTYEPAYHLLRHMIATIA